MLFNCIVAFVILDMMWECYIHNILLLMLMTFSNGKKTYLLHVLFKEDLNKNVVL